MREIIFDFLLFRFLAVHFNYYTCIAPAGATSEDTTLPVMLKYTNEETVVLSVLNRSDLFILCADTYFVLFEYKVKSI